MAAPGQHRDPLAFGHEDDMDDLTAQLEQMQRSHVEDPLDDPFGDGSELPPPGLDRYRMMAEEDDLPRTAGHTSVPAGLDHPSLTYGHLVAPSSHEEQAYTRPAPDTSLPQQPLQSDAGVLHPTSSGSGAAPPGTAAGVQQGGNGVMPAAAATAAPAASKSSRTAPMQFTVTDPVKRESPGLFGLKAGYVTYLLTTQMNQPVTGYVRGSKFAVRRRFRDFVALADTLKVKYRGYFLPPRPEKNAVEGQRMTDAFVEERRLALERYLNRLAQHPVVSKSPELAVFVQSENELESCPVWLPMAAAPKPGLLEGTAKMSKQLLGLEQSVLDPVEAVQATRRTSDPLRALRETAQAMSANNAAAPPLPPGEAELRHERENLEALRDALAQASRAAEKLVHRMDRCSGVSGDLGLAFFKLSKFEEAEGPALAQFTGTVRQSQSLAAGSKVMATSLVRAGRNQRRAVGKSAAELSALHDQLAAMPPAIKGLSTREKQLLTKDTLEADVEARHRSIRDLEAAGAKVLGGDPTKAKRVDDLRNEVAKLNCSIDAAKAEYERIMGVNKQELARTHEEFEEDMSKMVLTFCNSQALTSQKLAEVWLQLASELGSPADVLAQVRQVVLGAQRASGAEVAGGTQQETDAVRSYSMDGRRVEYSSSGDGAGQWADEAGTSGGHQQAGAGSNPFH